MEMCVLVCSTIDIFYNLSICRKRALLVNNIPTIIGAVLMFVSYYAKDPWPLILGRLIIGVSCGRYYV